MYSNAILLERIQLALLRGVATFLTSMLSMLLWHGLIQRQDMIPWGVYVGPSIVAAVVVAALMWSTSSRFPTHADELRPIAKGAIFTALILMAFSFFLQSDAYSRGTLILFVPLLVGALLGVNAFDRWLSRRVGRSSSAGRRVLLVGYGERGKRIAAALALRPGYYNVVGYLDHPASPAPADDSLERLGSTTDLGAVLDDEDIDEAIIAVDAPERELQDLIGVCLMHRVRWKIVPQMLGLRLDQVRFDRVGGLAVVEPRGSKLVGHNWYMKRFVDIAGSTLMLVILSPILIISYVLIRLTSKGPGIFRQERIGLRGRPFTMYKFRTMTVAADQGVHETDAVAWVFGDGYDGDGDEVTYKRGNDARVTKVGRVLRATSIDELPQLWNVAVGDMSLVGPRPPIEYEVDQYTHRDLRRLDVPPGITGLWQVSGRSSLSFDEMVDLDLDYIDSWSVALDVSILLRTIPAVVANRGK